MGEPQKNFGYAVQTTKSSREHSREKENSMNQDQRDKNALTMLFSILELQTIRSLKKLIKIIRYELRNIDTKSFITSKGVCQHVFSCTLRRTLQID